MSGDLSGDSSDQASRTIASLPAAPDTNQRFYEQLTAYPRKGFYLGLHYYTYILLKYRRHLPEAWVQREYLPVGAPDTQFFYGGLNQNQTMAIALTPEVLDQFDFYLTLYDWASFPMAWQRIQTPSATQTVPQNGSYAFRVRPKAITPAGIWPQFEEALTPDSMTVSLKFNAANLTPRI